jgi:hypothetical protein
MSYKKVFSKCSGADWFAGNACPRDGFSSRLTDHLFEIERKLHEAGTDITIDALVDAGFPREAMRQVMIVEVAEQAVIRRLYFRDPEDEFRSAGK